MAVHNPAPFQLCDSGTMKKFVKDLHVGVRYKVRQKMGLQTLD